jgi:hypothetical protein
VIEQAAEFKEIGAGIQLGPNVFRMFDLATYYRALADNQPMTIIKFERVDS